MLLNKIKRIKRSKTMSKVEEREIVSVKVPAMIKRRSQSAAIMNGISYQDFVAISLEHYMSHIEKGEIDFSGDFLKPE